MIYVLTLYAALSLFVLVAPQPLIKQIRDVFWAFGPPALLFHGGGAIAYFVVGTVASFAILWLTVRSERRWLRFTFSSLFVLCWLWFGLLAWSPTI